MNIIFDLDGTLFQTRLCIVGAVDQLFKEKGWAQIPVERIVRNIGKTSAQFLAGILPEGVEWHEVYDEFSAYERREIEEKAQLYEGTEELLSSLAGEGHRLYICSTGSEEYIRLVLEKTGILRWFDRTVSAKHTTKTEAVSRLLDEKGFAIMIGDTKTDFDAATDNNIPSIGVTYGYGDEEAREQATFLAGNAKEIAAYIKQIEVFSVLAERIVEGKKRTVGINGVDTSGKSTFAVNFACFLKSVGRKAVVLHIDDFHNPREIRLSGADEIRAYYDNAFNYGQVITEILEPLRKNGCIHRRIMCLDLDTDRYKNEVVYEITPDTILLIEGVLLFRDPLNQYLDYKVYLQIGFDEVIRRAEVRDVPKYGMGFLQRYRDKYIPIQKLYIEEHDPVHNSDMVIDNQDYLRPYIVQRS